VPELERSLKRETLNHTRELDRVDRRLRKLRAAARVRVAREQMSRLRGVNCRIDQLRVVARRSRQT
jgi:hypothetical protein